MAKAEMELIVKLDSKQLEELEKSFKKIKKYIDNKISKCKKECKKECKKRNNNG